VLFGLPPLGADVCQERYQKINSPNKLIVEISQDILPAKEDFYMDEEKDVKIREYSIVQ
jgi:hypothetical protein